MAYIERRVDVPLDNTLSRDTSLAGSGTAALPLEAINALQTELSFFGFLVCFVFVFVFVLFLFLLFLVWFWFWFWFFFWKIIIYVSF